MATPRWLDEEEQRAWRKLSGIILKLPGSLDTQLQRDAGLTHFGYYVMAVLSESRDRTLRMSELASRASASLSRVSHVVARLEAEGWVCRERAASDGRGQLATLTDRGYDKVVETAPGHVEAVRALVFDGLTRAQVRQLDRLGEALLQQIDSWHHQRGGSDT